MEIRDKVRSNDEKKRYRQEYKALNEMKKSKNLNVKFRALLKQDPDGIFL